MPDDTPNPDLNNPELAGKDGEDPTEGQDPEEGNTPAPSQDKPPEENPKGEVQKDKKPFTKKQRLLHARSKIDSELAELEEEDEEDLDRPLTLRDLKTMEKQEGTDQALQLAETIEDADERTAVIDILKKSIVPSGNGKVDFELARGAYNSIRNSQIVEEQLRKGKPGDAPAMPGGPGAKPEGEFVPTPTERIFMGPPYNLTKEQILKARAAETKG